MKYRVLAWHKTDNNASRIRSRNFENKHEFSAVELELKSQMETQGLLVDNYDFQRERLVEKSDLLEITQ